MGSSEKDIWGWIASNEADLAANYANRGRSYRDLSNDELTARWSRIFSKNRSRPSKLQSACRNRRFKK